MIKNVEIKSLQRKLTKMDDYIGQLKGDLRRLDKDNTDLRDKRRRMISEIETWERKESEREEAEKQKKLGRERS